MADNLIDFSEGADCELLNNPEFAHFPQTLVPEKIIFCLDVKLFSTDDDDFIHNIFFLVKSYFNLKKKICIKPPEFEFLLVANSDQIVHSYINNIKDLQQAFSTIKNLEYEEEEEPLQLDKLFTKIAEIVEIPDPSCYNKCLPPIWVYHVVWLFGQNFHVPTIENTNSFDFLMVTPYFALDILYIYNKTLEGNQCERISQALVDLNENNKGYFLSVDVNLKKKFFSCFAKLLGHPLIRFSQLRAKFNIMDLGPEPEISQDKIED